MQVQCLGLGQICSKLCPKCFQEFLLIYLVIKTLQHQCLSSQNFHLLCSKLFPLCLHYAPRLATFLTIIFIKILISECYIRAFHYKMTVLLESINIFNAFSSLQFPLTALLGNIDLHVLSWNEAPWFEMSTCIVLAWHSSLLCFYYAGPLLPYL